MGPVRIVILLFLLYILYRLATAPKKGKRPPAGPAGTPPPVTDVLEEDPVCHVCVPRAQAVSIREHGRTVYFCSRECLARYRERREG
jgi:YHS domain-containing protein